MREMHLLLRALVFVVCAKISMCSSLLTCWCWTILCVRVFFFFFFLGYRGIVHPQSDDGGAEQTWFEPEQRPLCVRLLHCSLLT